MTVKPALASVLASASGTARIAEKAKAKPPKASAVAASPPARQPKPGKIIVKQHYAWPRMTAPTKADLGGSMLSSSILFEPLSDNFPGIDFGMWNAFQVTISGRHRQWMDEEKEQWRRLFGEPAKIFFSVITVEERKEKLKKHFDSVVTYDVVLKAIHQESLFVQLKSK